MLWSFQKRPFTTNHVQYIRMGSHSGPQLAMRPLTCFLFFRKVMSLKPHASPRTRFRLIMCSNCCVLFPQRFSSNSSSSKASISSLAWKYRFVVIFLQECLTFGLTVTQCLPLTLLHWVPLITSTVTTSTRLQRAISFAPNSLHWLQC